MIYSQLKKSSKVNNNGIYIYIYTEAIKKTFLLPFNQSPFKLTFSYFMIRNNFLFSFPNIKIRSDLVEITNSEHSQI